MDTNAIKSNLIYRFLYFPDNGLSDYFIDLSWINSYPRFAILERQREGIINKIGSLNNFGYYLFCENLFALKVLILVITCMSCPKCLVHSYP